MPTLHPIRIHKEQPAIPGAEGTPSETPSRTALIGQTVEVNSLYSIAEIAAAILQAPPTPSFLKDTLFRETETWWGEDVAIDFYRGSSRISPYTTPYKRGIAIPREKFKTTWVVPPNIKVTRDIRALDARYRGVGESQYSRMSSQERIATLQALDYSELDLEISRAEEKQCRDVLFDGKIVLIDGDDMVEIGQIDFGPTNETIIDPAEYWDVAGSDPIEHLEAMATLVTASGFPCDLYILGVDAAAALLRNTAFKESSNFLNFRQGVVDVRTFTDYRNFGVKILGQFQGMDLVSYSAMYEDPLDKKMHFYFPPDKVLLASTLAQNRFTYSRITQVRPDSQPPVIDDFQMARVPQYVAAAAEDAILFRLWSRPLAVPVNTLSWTTAKVCTLKSQPLQLPSY